MFPLTGYDLICILGKKKSLILHSLKKKIQQRNFYGKFIKTRMVISYSMPTSTSGRQTLVHLPLTLDQTFTFI